MPVTKPNSFVNWVPDSTSTNLAVPPVAISTTGFQPSQPVPAQWLNSIVRTLDQWNQFLAEGINSTVLATSLDHSMRLIGGGTWAYSSASGVLSWSSAFQLACPSAPDSNNQAAAGQVTLAAGSVAYVTANLPFSTTGDVTSGSTTINNLGYEGGIAVGQVVSGVGIAQGTTVQSVSGTSCTLSAAATASSTQGSLTFVGSGALTVTAVSGSALIPGPNTVIVARCLGSVCSVGVGSTELWLRDREARSLVAAGYVTTVAAPAGAALTALQPVYLSQGTIDGTTLGSLYPCDASASHGATRAYPIGLIHTDTASGAAAHVVQGGFLSGFASLTPGAVYYLDPTVVGGITATRPTASGQYISPIGVAVSISTLLIHISASAPVTTTFPSLTVTGLSTLANVNATGQLNVSSSTTQGTAAILKSLIAGPTLVGYDQNGSSNWSVGSDGGASFAGAVSAGTLSATSITASNTITVPNASITAGLLVGNVVQAPIFQSTSSIVSSTGFKSYVDFGYCNYTSAPGTSVATNKASFAQSSGTAQSTAYTFVSGHTGSIVGFTGYQTVGSNSVSTTWTLLVNNNQVYSFTYQGSSSSIAQLIKKGQIAIAYGSVVQLCLATTQGASIQSSWSVAFEFSA